MVLDDLHDDLDVIDRHFAKEPEGLVPVLPVSSRLEGLECGVIGAVRNVAEVQREIDVEGAHVCLGCLAQKGGWAPLRQRPRRDP